MEVLVEDLNSIDTFGLICLYSNQGWYEFDVNGGGVYAIRFAQSMDTPVDEERYVIKTGAIEGFRYSTVTSSENSIRVRCNGNKLSLSVNNTRLLNEYPARYSLEKGRIGIAIRSYENHPVHVILKSITIKEP
jgi:hypothetical protein